VKSNIYGSHYISGYTADSIKNDRGLYLRTFIMSRNPNACSITIDVVDLTSMFMKIYVL